jgi:DNA-binding transcriptional LysR family regulator
VLPDERSTERGIYAVYPSRKQLAPKVRLMVDFLAAAFERPDWPA